MVRVRYEETRGPHEEFKTHRGANFLAAKSQRLSEVGNADGPNWKMNLETGLTHREWMVGVFLLFRLDSKQDRSLLVANFRTFLRLVFLCNICGL